MEIIKKLKKIIKRFRENPKKTIREIFYNYILWVVQLSYSSTWEDVILDWLIKKEKGFYIDIWWYDPIYGNNTYLFYKKWWTWINVEPNKKWFKKFTKKRKKDINLQIALWIKNSNLKFFVFDDKAISTCDPKTAKRYEKSWHKIIEKYNVPIWTLEKICDKYVKNKKIDILSIDVEWWDMNVLKSNNRNKYKPTYIILETVEYAKEWKKTRKKQNEKFDPYLKNKWYCIIAETWINTIYKLN